MSDTLIKDVWDEACSRQSEHTTMSDTTLNSDARFVIELFGLDEDLTEWAGKAELLEWEAVRLMHGISPDRWRDGAPRDGDLPDSVTSSVKHCVELAKRRGHTEAAPSFWIAWGKEQKLDRFEWEAFPEMDVDRVCLWGLFADLVEEGGRTVSGRLVTKMEQRKSMILGEIREQGLIPTALPKLVSGYSGTPSKVWGALIKKGLMQKTQRSVFNKAWQACLEDGSIIYAK
ncbi:hypothetical protein [Nitrosomonas halophila]|uniref:Uncharacterized protein n=1 Tax=Nitrosomonas halophila TaxID=44576 RepID=A0A1H3JDP7_9PROT|nr:hypothetical protein [Nitrosomonas halophila]SDY38032.1 hypothetical protein SAMN05421881_103227 [Nitrosomonas halophila]